METSTAGKLLIAAPTLLDPNFARTVLFMVEHNEEGALGLVLNRPTASPVRDHVAPWAPLATPPPLIFVGGPVANEIAVGLAQEPGNPPEPWPEPLPGIGLVDLSEPPATYGGVGRIRIFSGYAGWDAGQLDFELSTSSWIVAPATADAIFSAEPAHLWRSVLTEGPGLPPFYATFPDDPRLN